MKRYITIKRKSFHPFVFFALIATILFVSCSKNDVTSDTDENTNNTGSPGNTSSGSIAIADIATISTAKEGNSDSAANPDDIIANSTFTTQVQIAFNGTTATITNPLAASTINIVQSNGDVIVTSTAKEVEYVLSGTTTNGSVKIYSDNKFKLTLNGVSITNNDGPAINIQSKKRVFVVLADNTVNTLADGANYATSTEDMKSTVFSEGQLVFTGNGTLNVKGNYKHAIASDDYIRVQSGTINITDAVSDGIHTNDAFIADGGVFNIKTSSDGIESEEGYIVINKGNFTINVIDDAIAASWETDTTIDPFVTINGGSFNITTTEGEGIESKSKLTINNGTFKIITFDDGLNAAGAIYINGGVLYVYSNNNDAIDSNGILTITGGKIVAVGAGSPEGGIDCDNNQFKITGGIIVGMGGSTSMPTANVSTQRSVRLGGANANQIVHIVATDGSAEALTVLAPRTFATMLFSSPKLKASTSYQVYIGGAVSNGIDENGLYTGGLYTKGNAVSGTSFTTTSMVTIAGGSGGPGGGR